MYALLAVSRVGNAKYRGWVGWLLQELFAGKEGKTHPSTPEGMEWVYSGKSGLLALRSNRTSGFLVVEIARGRFELVAPRTRAIVYLHPVSAVIRNMLPRRRPCGLGVPLATRSGRTYFLWPRYT